MDQNISESEQKTAKLAHYGARELNTFTQFDVFHWAGRDGCFPSDEDGDNVFGPQITEELMVGSDVRVLIGSTVSRAKAARMLRKLVAILEHNEERVSDWVANRAARAAKILQTTTPNNGEGPHG